MQLKSSVATRLQDLAKDALRSGQPVSQDELASLASEQQVPLATLRAGLLEQLRALQAAVVDVEAAGSRSGTLRESMGQGGAFAGQRTVDLTRSPALRGTNLSLPGEGPTGPEPVATIGSAPAPKSRLGDVEVAKQTLTTIPNLDLRGASVEPLPGGATNDLFRVNLPAEGGKFVLRLAGEGNAHIDHRRDVAAARRAAELGLGPALRFVSDDFQVQLVEFVEAPPVSKEQLAPGSGSGLDDVAAALRELHDGPPLDDPSTFNPFRRIRESAEVARARGTLSPALEEQLGLVDDLERRLLPRYEASQTPCHNDMNPGNVLLEKGKAHLIDWDYAANGDPMYDLGTFAVCLGLDDKQQSQLLGTYLGVKPDEVPPEKSAHLEVSRLTNTLWAAMWFAAKTEAPGDLPAQISKANLDEFVARSGGGALQRALDLLDA